MLWEEYAMNEIREGIHRHYKGNLYRVLCVAKHSDTLEEMVVYQDAIDEEKVWARPLSMWDEEVDVGGEKLPRFQFLAPSRDELDQNPVFRLIEAIKDNLEQYQHFGEFNTLRFYHKPTGDILEVDEGLLGLLEDGEDMGDHAPHHVPNVGKLLEHREEYLRLPDDDVNAYGQMERFICELPIRYQDDLERAIRGKGAFRRFKDTAARLGVLNEWYRYLAAAYRREARAWCEANGIVWWKDLV
jgi:hypothetical protein